MKKKNQSKATLKTEGKFADSKLTTLLRNIIGIILFVISGFLIAVFTPQLSILITTTTVYAGGKMPMFALWLSIPALFCLAGLVLRRFKRWKRDIGLVLILGWLFYLPYMFATVAVFLNKTHFPTVLEKYAKVGSSFVDFSFAVRAIWIMNLLLAIYFIRADRKSYKKIKA